MAKAKQPDRQSRDGAINVERLTNEDLRLTVEQDGVSRFTEMSEYNAWRAFGTLALMLGIKLPKELGKSIQLVDGKHDLKAKFV